MSKIKKLKKRSKYYFFLSPYQDCAFTRCPKCDNKTKLKKFPLVIHVEPRHFLTLGKTCKYCPQCDLIILKQTELEPFMVAAFEKQSPDIIGNEYLVIGTLEYKVWRQGLQKQIHSDELVNFMYPFKDHWHFEVKPAGWYPNEEK